MVLDLPLIGKHVDTPTPQSWVMGVRGLQLSSSEFGTSSVIEARMWPHVELELGGGSLSCKVHAQ